jgi:hypothetical protein
MRVIRLMTATALASVMTVFAILGMVHLVEIVTSGLGESPIAVSQDRLDFGKIPLHGSATQRLIVRNDSGAAVHARFLVRGTTYRVDPDELFLEPGVAWEITVEASPEKPGQLHDVLRIQVVGAVAAAVVIPLAAEASEDEVWHEPGSELNRV